MYKDVKNVFLSSSKTWYELEKIYKIVSECSEYDVNDLKNKYYEEFYKIIKQLEVENIIKPVGKNQNSSLVMPLYKKYGVVREKLEYTLDEKLTMVKLDKLDLSYYNKRIKEFRADVSILNKLNSILREKEQYKELSVNELSYLVFGYEKSIAPGKKNKIMIEISDVVLETSKVRDEESNVIGEVAKVMGKVGVTTVNLGCRLNNEPLLNTIFKGFYCKDIRNILIVENLDTYWSFNKLCRNFDTNIDMLIWGQGYSITGNFYGCTLYGVTENDVINYFGDIDLAGVDIFSLLVERFSSFNIKPCESLYIRTLATGENRGINNSVSQKQIDVDENKLNDFLKYFKEDVAKKLAEIVVTRKYIPQEALNYSLLKGWVDDEQGLL